MLQDIQNLKNSKPNAEKLLQIKPEMDKLYSEKKEIKEKLDTYNATLKEVEDGI